MLHLRFRLDTPQTRYGIWTTMGHIGREFRARCNVSGRLLGLQLAFSGVVTHICHPRQVPHFEFAPAVCGLLTCSLAHLLRHFQTLTDTDMQTYASAFLGLSVLPIVYQRYSTHWH